MDIEDLVRYLKGDPELYRELEKALAEERSGKRSGAKPQPGGKLPTEEARAMFDQELQKIPRGAAGEDARFLLSQRFREDYGYNRSLDPEVIKREGGEQRPADKRETFQAPHAAKGKERSPEQQTLMDAYQAERAKLPRGFSDQAFELTLKYRSKGLDI